MVHMHTVRPPSNLRSLYGSSFLALLQQDLLHHVLTDGYIYP